MKPKYTRFFPMMVCDFGEGEKKERRKMERRWEEARKELLTKMISFFRVQLFEKKDSVV